MERIPDSQPDPEMVCAEGKTFRLINGVLGGMKPVLRKAFKMSYYDEMSIPEACAWLGVSTGAFKARLFRALRHLSNEANRFLPRPLHKRADLTFSFAPSEVQPCATSAVDISSSQVTLS